MKCIERLCPICKGEGGYYADDVAPDAPHKPVDCRACSGRGYVYAGGAAADERSAERDYEAKIARPHRDYYHG